MGRLVSVRVLALLSIALVLAAAAINRFLLQPHNSLPARGDAELPLPSVKGPPILKLELVWRDDDITQILAPTDDREARARNIADARAGNTFDTVLFVPTYALLLMTLNALAAASGRGFDRWFAGIVIFICIVAIGDWLENYGIAKALDHLEAGGVQRGDARTISNPSLVKWSLLPLVTVLTGVQFVRAGRSWTIALGVLAIACGAFIAYGLAAYAHERAYSTENTVSAK